MSYDTIFRLASMTKPLTSVAIMMLYDEGKIALDYPVSKYIPEFANPKVVTTGKPRVARREITIRHLLTHTSGLANEHAEKVGEFYAKADIQGGVCLSSVLLDENIRRLASIPLLFDPGERFHYGLSTDVLGLVVERVSGMKLDEFIEKRICKPLGMDDTFFHIPLGKQERLAAAYVADGTVDAGLRELGDSEQLRTDRRKLRVSPDYPCSASHRYLSGGAGMSSTAEDYLRFCQMILNRGRFNDVALLRPTTIDMMTTNQVGDLECGVASLKFKFGLGFAVFPRTDDMLSEINWGGFWGTVFRISKEGNWIGILMTQRAFDETSVPREGEFTRLVREAIQNREGR
jgi:CubicO group peptidase (beta-lactamase class C family)